MRTPKYPSDLTDQQWALVKGRIPVSPGAPPRPTSIRDRLDAICYVLRPRGPWRFLPKDFPPTSTVGRYFDAWRHHGLAMMPVMRNHLCPVDGQPAFRYRKAS